MVHFSTYLYANRGNTDNNASSRENDNGYCLHVWVLHMVAGVIHRNNHRLPNDVGCICVTAVCFRIIHLINFKRLN